jgi:hypothetical protein
MPTRKRSGHPVELVGWVSARGAQSGLRAPGSLA